MSQFPGETPANVIPPGWKYQLSSAGSVHRGGKKSMMAVCTAASKQKYEYNFEGSGRDSDSRCFNLIQQGEGNEIALKFSICKHKPAQTHIQKKQKKQNCQHSQSWHTNYIQLDKSAAPEYVWISGDSFIGAIWATHCQTRWWRDFFFLSGSICVWSPSEYHCPVRLKSCFKSCPNVEIGTTLSLIVM